MRSPTITVLQNSVLFQLCDQSGDGYRLHRTPQGELDVTLFREGSVAAHRRVRDPQWREVRGLFEFALSVHRAIEDDIQNGTVRDSLQSHHEVAPEAGLMLYFDVLGNSNDSLYSVLEMETTDGAVSVDVVVDTSELEGLVADVLEMEEYLILEPGPHAFVDGHHIVTLDAGPGGTVGPFTAVCTGCPTDSSNDVTLWPSAVAGAVNADPVSIAIANGAAHIWPEQVSEDELNMAVVMAAQSSGSLEQLGYGLQLLSDIVRSRS